MICGKVTGQVWSTKHIDTLPNGALLEVEVDGKSLIAFDPLDVQKEKPFLLLRGLLQQDILTKSKAPIDALIIGSIDE